MVIASKGILYGNVLDKEGSNFNLEVSTGGVTKVPSGRIFLVEDHSMDMPHHNNYAGYHIVRLTHDVELNLGPKVVCRYCTNIYYPGPILALHYLRFHHEITILVNMHMLKGKVEKAETLLWIKRVKQLKKRIRKILKWLNLPVGIPLTTLQTTLEDYLSVIRD